MKVYLKNFLTHSIASRALGLLILFLSSMLLGSIAWGEELHFCHAPVGGLAELVADQCEIEAARCMLKFDQENHKDDEHIQDLIKTCPDDNNKSTLEQLGSGCFKGWNEAWFASIEATRRYMEACAESMACKETLFFETHQRQPGEKEKARLQKLKSFAEMDVFYRTAQQVRNSTGQSNLRLQQEMKNRKALETGDKTPSLPQMPSHSFWEAVRNVINEKTDKFQCLNAEGKSLMVCYGVFTIIDPLVAAGMATKLPKLASLLRFTRVEKAAEKTLETSAKIDDGTKAILEELGLKEDILKADGLSNKGLSLEGNKLIGSTDGGLVAKIIEKYSNKYDVKFLIDDQKFVGHPDKTGAIIQGDTIYFRSRFLENPNIADQIHELSHAIRLLKNDKTRLIFVEINDVEHATNIEGYERKFRFDEIEARLVESKVANATRKERLFQKAKAFLEAQKKIVRQALDEIKNGEAIVSPTFDNKRPVLRVQLFIDTSATRKDPGRVVLQIPYEGGPATTQQYENYITQILEQRMKQLEDLEKGRLR